MVEKLDSGIEAFEAFQNLRGVICRAVIQNDELIILKCL